MRLYFAGYTTDKEIAEVEGVECLLESYILFRRKDYRAWHQEYGLLDKELFLDSGAFSAFASGETVDLDGYIEYIKKYEDCFEVYAGLDVIGDWQATAKNIEKMESAGLKPLPTFHAGSPLEELERMCEKYDYIALGGLVPLAIRPRKMKKWLDSCFSVIKRHWPVKVHGFGVNAFWAWERYPWYSVDATSWLMGGKFRHMVRFKDGKLVSRSKKDPDQDLDQYMLHAADYKVINQTNVREYLKAQKFITDLWQTRGVSWE